MPAPPARTEISDTFPNPSNAVARAGLGKFYDYVKGLLGATGNTADAHVALGTTSWVASVIGSIATSAGFASSFGLKSYVKFPSWLGGLIVQWGTTVTTTDGSGNASVTFPLTFPGSLYGAMAVNGDSASISGAALMSMYTTGWPTTSGFAVHVCNSTNAVSYGTASIRINWIALGG